MSLSAPFVILTYWNTIVTHSGSEHELSHNSKVNIDSKNIVFTKKEGALFACGNNLSPPDNVACPTVWDIEEDAHANTIRLKQNGTYACAHKHGAITFSRKKAKEWETFRAITLREFYDSFQMPAKSPVWRQQYIIPRIIHQIFIQGNPPGYLRDNIESLKAGNPTYRHILWTGPEMEEFIVDNYGREILNVYLKINPDYGAARADLFRYLCIYKLGGIYLDIKSNSRVPLPKIVTDDGSFVISQWDRSGTQQGKNFGLWRELSGVPGGEYQQWHVIGPPGHPFLERVINRIISNIYRYDPKQVGVGFVGVLRTTGPIAYTLAISEIIDAHPHRFINAQEAGLHYKAVSGYKRAFAVHYSTLDTPIVLAG